MAYWEYPRYVPVGEKKANAARKLKQLKKKNPNITPVVIEGRAIAKTWWGKSWNTNLERYADYSNRIERGRSYVRHGTVLDLQINRGHVTALVNGTALYSVTIDIAAISKKKWQVLKETCQGKLDSLQQLMTGKFPKALSDLFTAEGSGLFPTPSEISFDCSCPDAAYMCKHVAAVLYGIGARLDQDPRLFFELRGVNMDELIDVAIGDSTKGLLDKARQKSSKVMQDVDLADVFGIDFSDDGSPVPSSPTKKKKQTAPKAAQKPSSKAVKQKSKITKPKKVKQKVTPISKPKRKLTAKKSPAVPKNITASTKSNRNDQPHLTAIEIVEAAILKKSGGANCQAIINATGFEEKKVRNCVYRLKQLGRIRTKSRGVYVKNTVSSK